MLSITNRFLAKRRLLASPAIVEVSNSLSLERNHFSFSKPLNGCSFQNSWNMLPYQSERISSCHYVFLSSTLYIYPCFLQCSLTKLGRGTKILWDADKVVWKWPYKGLNRTDLYINFVENIFFSHDGNETHTCCSRIG